MVELTSFKYNTHVNKFCIRITFCVKIQPRKISCNIIYNCNFACVMEINSIIKLI